MWSVAINASLAFIMAITLIFTLGDVDSLFESVTRQPFIQLFYNATRSYAATNSMVAIVIILLVACCVSEVATASRQIWSFARDGGLPGSGWISQVSLHNLPEMKPFGQLLLGNARLEYSTSGRSGLSGGELFARLHQSWLLGRFARCQLSWGRFYPHVILYYDWLSDLEATQRTAVTVTTMVTGEIRSSHQRCSPHVPDTSLVLRILATGDSGSGVDYELVFRHVRRHYNCCACLLLCEGEARVHWTCNAGQTRRLERCHIGIIMSLISRVTTKPPYDGRHNLGFVVCGIRTYLKTAIQAYHWYCKVKHSF